MYALWLGRKGSSSIPIGVKHLENFTDVEEAVSAAAHIVKGLGATILEAQNACTSAGGLEKQACIMVHDMTLPFVALVVGAQLTDTTTAEPLPIGAATHTVSLIAAAEA